MTDSQRREVAERLRNCALFTRGTCADWWECVHEVVTGECGYLSPPVTVAAISALIDRPTCMFKPAYEPDVMGKVSLVECSKCGWTIEPWNAAGFNYCPNCGAEVVADDD